MKKKAVLILMAVVFISGIAGRVSASVWDQLFQQSSAESYKGHQVGSFDEMQVFWQGNDKFATPAFSNFSVSNWQNFSVSNTQAYAAGPDSTFLLFNLNFNNINPPSQTEFLYQASLDGQVVQRQILTYAGNSGWTWPEFTGSDQDWHNSGGGDPVPVPEPASLIIFLSGGVAMAAGRSRGK